MNKQKRILFYKLLSESIPFLAVLSIVSLPADPLLLRQSLKTYLIFIFLFITWRAVRELFLYYKTEEKVFISHHISMFFFSLVTLLLLHSLKEQLADSVFHFLLISLFDSALMKYYEFIGRAVMAVVSNFFYVFLSVLLSFAALGAAINNATLTFSFAVTSISLARYLAALAFENHITIRGDEGEKFKIRGWVTLYSLALISAPVSIIGLVTFAYLPHLYSLIMVLIPLSVPLLSKAKFSDGKNLKTDDFFIDTSGISLLFIAIIALLGFV